MSEEYFKIGRVNRKNLNARDKSGKVMQPQFSFVMSPEERKRLQELKSAGINMSEMFRECINKMHAEFKENGDEDKSKRRVK